MSIKHSQSEILYARTLIILITEKIFRISRHEFRNEGVRYNHWDPFNLSGKT